MAGTSFPTGERELLLRRAVEPLPTLWDVVLIDCPPSLGLLTVNALAAADTVLIPVKLDSASRTPLVRLFIAAEEIHQTLNPRLDCLGVAGTFYKKTGNHQADMMNWLRSQFSGHGDDEGAEDLVFRTAIRDNTHIRESHGFQMPVTHYMREQKIRHSNGLEPTELFPVEKQEAGMDVAGGGDRPLRLIRCEISDAETDRGKGVHPTDWLRRAGARSCSPVAPGGDPRGSTPRSWSDPGGPISGTRHGLDGGPWPPWFRAVPPPPSARSP